MANTKKQGLSVDKVLSSKSKKRETWSQTKRSNDITEEMRVEKLDNNGYLVVISKNWYDAKGAWKEKELKIYSETNPLDANEFDNPIDGLFKVITGDRK